jgi:REP element-mobilizing transposase RayT
MRGFSPETIMTTYFITACAHMQQNLFQPDQVADLMVATLLKYRDAGEFELHDYVVMPNHIHVLLSLNEPQQLGRAIQLIKGGFSHSLRENGSTIELCGNSGITIAACAILTSLPRFRNTFVRIPCAKAWPKARRNIAIHRRHVAPVCRG